MTPAALAKLTAQACPLSRGTGGLPDLTPAEIAGTLAVLPTEAQYLALYRYVGDESVLHKLQYMAIVEVAGVFAHERWRDYRQQHGPMCRKLALLALWESLHREPCHDCGGTRYAPAGGWCERCGGTGYERDVPDAVRARAVDMKYSTWIATWRPRYRLVLRHVGGWLATLDCAIWTGLRGQ